MSPFIPCFRWPKLMLLPSTADQEANARDGNFIRAVVYHSHPQWHRTEWLRWDLSINVLHTAHNLIHITRLLI